LARIAAIAATLTFSSLGRAAEPDWPDHLTIGTASPGGTYFVYGTGLAQILTRALDLPVVARPTEGPAENVALLEAGEAKLGFVTIGVALQGKTIHPHPTLGESIGMAAELFEGECTDLPPQKKK
jgi:hypothetical protein